MGNANSGRKGTSENSAEVKQKLAEIAFEGVKYLGQCALGKIRPSAKRVEIIQEAINHTIGKPQQQVNTNLMGELVIRVVYEDSAQKEADESEISAQKKTPLDSGGPT